MTLNLNIFQRRCGTPSLYVIGTQTSTSPKQASSFKTNSHPSPYPTLFIGCC